jgi:hypothetical protein
VLEFLTLTAGALFLMLLLLLLRSKFYKLFFVILLVSEFYYIQIGDGTARIYQFLAVIVVLSLVRFIPRLFKSWVFWALLVFVSVNLCAMVLSDTSEKAFASFLSLGANIAIAMATALILLTGRVDLASFKRLILTVTLVSVLWGLFQIIAFSVAGVVLALSPQQETQILLGFGPAFRTEANTFAKYMVFPLLFFLPDYIEQHRIKHIGIYVVFLIGFLMNFTRSSIYGVGIAIIFVVIWYARIGKLALLTIRSAKISGVIAVCITLMVVGILNVNEYTLHKIDNLFSRQEILEGDSSGYRLQMMQFVLDDALSSTKKMIIGNGWGQTRIMYLGTEVQAGGADLVNVLGYCGLIGIAVYLIYTLLALTNAKEISQSSPDIEKARFAEGVMFALVGIFCTAQMAGYLITPEYWMLVGLCIYLSVRERHLRTNAQMESW